MLYRELSAPINIQLELTTRCTNNCPHCYNYWRQEGDIEASITKENLAVIFDKLSKARIFSVTITGGEPLIYPNVILETIRLCKEKNIDCSINSNLTLANNKLISRLQEAGEFKVLTSIASYKEEIHDAMMGRKGSFRKTIRGIEALKELGVGFAANMVVTQLNADHVYDTGVFAANLGASMFTATKASPPNGCSDFSAIKPSKEQVKNSLNDLLRLEKERGVKVDILESYPLCFFGEVEKYKNFSRRNCSAGILSGAIGADGQVRPCAHSSRVYGSIFEEDLPAIYSRMTEWRTGELIPKKCLSCSHFRDCSGGCRCEAEYYGDISGMDPLALGPNYVKPIKKHPTPKNIIPKNAKVSVLPDVSFREELFGYILKRNRSISMVDKDAGILLLKLQKSEMTLNEITKNSISKKADIYRLLNGMAWKKILTWRISQS